MTGRVLPDFPEGRNALDRTRNQRRIAAPLGLATLLAALIASPLQAAPVQGRAAAAYDTSLKLSLGPAVLGFRYREESADGSLLDQERGALPGFCAAAAQGRGRVFVRVAGCYYRGTVSYDGHTQSGVPVSTDTDESLGDGRLEVGARFGVPGARVYRIYGLVGYRRWERTIRSTPSVNGLSETYTWPYVGLGANGVLLRRGRWQWNADLQLREPVRPRVHIDFRGLYDTSTVRPAALPGFRLALPLTYRLSPTTGVTVTPYWDFWRLGKSDVNTLYQGGVPVGTVHEPASRTSSPGVSLQVYARY